MQHIFSRQFLYFSSILFVLSFFSNSIIDDIKVCFLDATNAIVAGQIHQIIIVLITTRTLLLFQSFVAGRARDFLFC